MELLGPNLREVEENCPGKQFSLNQMYRIIIQLLDRLRVLHSLNYVHGDLKLQNMCYGMDELSSRVYLIDFGCSFHYMNNKGVRKVNQNNGRHLGNIMFASVPVCRGNWLSPRDDIESLLYILLYIHTKHKLPWNRYQKDYGEHKLTLNRLRVLRSTDAILDEVVKLFPTDKFKVFYRDHLKLKYEDVPDYDSLHSCLAEAFT